MRPKIISTKELYSGRIFDIRKVRIEEDGLVYDREIIVHGGSAVVIPIHENRDITLVRQYRHAAGDVLLELPAGTVEKGETPAACAHRELAEETRYKAEELTELTEFYVSPGFLTEKMFLFAATGLSPTPSQPDFDENIELVRVSLAKAVEFIETGEIADAKSIIGVLLVLRGQKPVN